MPKADASQSTTPHSPNRSSSAKGPGEESRRERGRKPETISSAPYQRTPPSRPSPAWAKEEIIHTGETDASKKTLVWISKHKKKEWDDWSKKRTRVSVQS